MRSLVISYKLLGTVEWLLVHHTNCGMEFFTDEVIRGLPARQNRTISIDSVSLGDDLKHATDTIARDELAGMARAELEAFITDLILRREAETPDPNTITLIAWDGDLDRIWPTTILATTAAAGGMDVAVFFTFWGLSRSCARRSG